MSIAIVLVVNGSLGVIVEVLNISHVVVDSGGRLSKKSGIV